MGKHSARTAARNRPARLSAADRAGIEAAMRAGARFHQGGNVVQAEALYRQVLGRDPGNADALRLLGVACLQQGRRDEGIRLLGEALQRRPGDADGHYNLGNALREEGRHEEAAASYRRALALEPRLAEAHYNLGNAYKDLERYEDALAGYERALALRPNDAETVWNRGLLRLTLGDLERGYRDYEWRFRHPDISKNITLRRFPYPEWKGQPLAGKRILVWGEQGIGDEIHFAGVFPDLIAAAGRCAIECAPKLVPLFAQSFPEATVVAMTDPPHELTGSGFDYQAPAGDLCRWLRPTLASFPSRPAYLAAPPGRVAYWKERLAAGGAGPAVGFSWRSRNLSGTRSLEFTEIDQWEPILRTAGARFVSLQYDECTAELERARERFGATVLAFPEVDQFNDLVETAALMSALDLVISTPAAVSVQAAALGVPVWQMFYGPDWRRLGTEHSPWHPRLVRFPRAWNRSWDDVIADIAGCLSRHVEGRARPRQ